VSLSETVANSARMQATCMHCGRQIERRRDQLMWGWLPWEHTDTRFQRCQVASAVTAAPITNGGR